MQTDSNPPLPSTPYRWIYAVVLGWLAFALIAVQVLNPGHLVG